MKRLTYLLVFLILLVGRQTSAAFAAEEHAAPEHAATQQEAPAHESESAVPEHAISEHAAPAHGTEATEVSHAPEHGAAAGVHGESEVHGAESGPPIELPDLTEYLKHFFGGPVERAGNWSDLPLRLARPVLRDRPPSPPEHAACCAGAAKREMIPGPFQNAIEYVVEAFYNFVKGILGHTAAREFAPFLGTLFLYIWFMNLSGLIPLFKAPTSLFETTLSLGAGRLPLCADHGLPQARGRRATSIISSARRRT